MPRGELGAEQGGGLRLPINTPASAVNYGNWMSTKGWPVHSPTRMEAYSYVHGLVVGVKLVSLA
ncbi:hypothetical protein, partial [Candidatus Paracaedibacter symbiosus]|uniref:hypothetical protein n=1 Tax=Candidatus Paracaedibacter symbiosus TaxID=244582 RepID=UPI001E637202